MSGSENTHNGNSSISIGLENEIVDLPNPGDDENISHDVNTSIDDDCDSVHVTTNSTDEADSDSEDLEVPSLKSRLRSWGVKHRSVSAAAKNELLKILRSENLPLPKTFKTLYDDYLEPRFMRSFSGGEFAYFSIEFMLNHPAIMKYIFPFIPPSSTKIELCIHIDGLPLFDSSRVEFQPILASIYEIIFPVAVFCGKGKPKLVHEFLEDLVAEMNTLRQNGLLINGKRYSLHSKMILADALEKSYILQVKGHGGRSSCPFCWAPKYTDLSAPLRTSDEFRRRADPEYHNKPKTSPFVEYADFDFIKHIPPDYMHFWCLGVMKRFMKYTLNPKRKKRNVAWGRNYKEINRHLKMLRKERYCPSEFARQPRTLKEYSKFKATEFRQLMLYTGVVLLKKFPEQYKKLFLMLMVSIRFLTTLENSESRESTLGYVEELLKLFVQRSKKTLGKKFITYNVHMLIHVVFFCRVFGSVDNFSCFKFESELGTYKRSIKSGNRPLRQFINRLSEKLIAMKEARVPKQRTRTPVLLKPYKKPNREEQRVKYQQLKYKGVHLNLKRIGDRFCEINGHPFMVQDIIHDSYDSQIYLSGKRSHYVLYRLPSKSYEKSETRNNALFPFFFLSVFLLFLFVFLCYLYILQMGKERNLI